MSIERLENRTVSLLQGQGLDLPRQAARVRNAWLPGRDGQPPLLVVVLLWGRECTDVVRLLDDCLDSLLADLHGTPAAWSPAQAARQVLAALNQQLFSQRRSGLGGVEVHAGLLLLLPGEAQFLQAGDIGLLRYIGGSLQSLAGREGQLLGRQAELALVQHSLPLNGDEYLLLAPQALLDVADLQRFREDCGALPAGELQSLLAPLLKAPGAAALLRPAAPLAGEPDVALPPPHWPALADAQPGQWLDGWCLLAECPYGPPGRLFQAEDEQGRSALLLLAAADANEAFWQREWAMRRSPVASLAQVMSSHRPRCHAFSLFAPPSVGTRSLLDWAAAHGPLDGPSLLALLEQLIVAVRALQRRGMQGLWLHPRNILIDEHARLVLLVEHAALLPGVPLQAMPSGDEPLAPELRKGRAVDGRADQFALAALAYWLFCGRWPDVALAAGGSGSQYLPLAHFTVRVPAGWDGVLARALAPMPEARFDALSEFQLALHKPLQHPEPHKRKTHTPQAWRLVLAAIVLLQLLMGLWMSLLLG